MTGRWQSVVSNRPSQQLDPMLLEGFVREVRQQCDFALIAVQGLNDTLNSGGGVDGAFFYCHGFLTHAANLSKLLWPGAVRGDATFKNEVSSRGRLLRSELSIPQGLLIESRKFRDHLEHFDERLHSWARESPNRLLLDMNVAPAGSISVMGSTPGDSLRHLDPSAMVMSFRGDTLELQRAADEVVHLRTAAADWEARQASQDSH
jgi:hypothetical protein